GRYISEGFVIVGTANTDTNENLVYNYRQRGPDWTPIANDLLVPEAIRTSEAGSAVAIDGDTAVIAARDYDNRGAVFVVTAVAGTDNWQLQSTLQPGDIQTNDQFGYSVALSGDSLIVGAIGKGDLNEGAVYFFERLGSAWTEKAEFIGGAGWLLGSDVDVF